MTHLLFFFPAFLRRAARVANSNTSRTPSLVLAEHSRYLVALMLLATVVAYYRIALVPASLMWTARCRLLAGHLGASF